jgi:hypothetical protein
LGDGFQVLAQGGAPGGGPRGRPVAWPLFRCKKLEKRPWGGPGGGPWGGPWVDYLSPLPATGVVRWAVPGGYRAGGGGGGGVGEGGSDPADRAGWAFLIVGRPDGSRRCRPAGLNT